MLDSNKAEVSHGEIDLLDIKESEDVFYSSMDEYAVRDLLLSTNPKDDTLEPSRISTVIDNNGNVVGLKVEKVARYMRKSPISKFEGLILIAVNNYPLSDMETVKEQVSFLSTEPVESLTFVDKYNNKVKVMRK